MLISYGTFFSFAAANYLHVVHKKIRKQKNSPLFEILDRQKSRFSDRPIDQTYSNIRSSLG